MRLAGTFAALFYLSAMTCAHAAETIIKIQGPTGELGGAMISPESPISAPVLIIPGSGPTDRDGDSPLGIKARPYKLLAEALAARNVPSVRIDKRGMFLSSGAGDPNAVTIPSYAQDIAAWTKAVTQRAGTACVWLLGHSEGGLVALAAAQSDAKVCGIILVSAAGRPLGRVLREQLEANPANAPILPDALSAIEALEAGERVDVSSFHPALKPLFAPQVQGFLISAFALDPAALLASYPGPALVAQGDNDIQVSLADARRLAQARDGVQALTVPGMNHVLKLAPSDRGANLAAYADPSLPIAGPLVDAVVAFVRK